MIRSKLSLKLLLAVFLISSSLSAEKSAPAPQTEYILSRKCAIAMATAGVSAGAFSVLALPYALSFVGFTAAGVAGGSLAAAWQATMGGVVAGGSLFAVLQAISVAGLSWSGTAVISGASGAAVAAFCEWINLEESVL